MMPKRGINMLFDIHAASVGVVVYVTTEENKQRMLLSYRETIAINLQSSEDERITKIVQLVKELAKKIHAKLPLIVLDDAYEKRVESIRIVFAPLWSTIYPIKIDVSRDIPFLITERFLQSLAQREQGKLPLEDDRFMEVIRTSYEHIKINGYSISDPLNKSAHRVEGYMYVIQAQGKLRAGIRRALEHYFMRVVYTEYAGGEVYIQGVEQLKSSLLSHYGIIFVDDDITTIFFSAQGYVEAQSSFPAGIHHLALDLAPHGDITSITLSFSRLELDAAGEPEWKGAVKEKIEKHITDWKDTFEKVLKTLKEQHVIPHTYYVLGSGASEYIVKAVEEVEGATYAGNHTDEIQVIRISEELTHAIVDEQSVEADPGAVFLTYALQKNNSVV